VLFLLLIILQRRFSSEQLNQIIYIEVTAGHGDFLLAHFIDSKLSVALRDLDVDLKKTER
jgi:hypothetical protein